MIFQKDDDEEDDDDDDEDYDPSEETPLEGYTTPLDDEDCEIDEYVLFKNVLLGEKLIFRILRCGHRIVRFEWKS